MFGTRRIALWRDPGSGRQSRIDKMRYPEFIMKLANCQWLRETAQVFSFTQPLTPGGPRAFAPLLGLVPPRRG